MNEEIVQVNDDGEVMDTSREYSLNNSLNKSNQKLHLEQIQSNFSSILIESEQEVNIYDRERMFEEEDYISMNEQAMFMKPFEHVSEGKYKQIGD